jgi:Flp pilus assembly protein TadG
MLDLLGSFRRDMRGVSALTFALALPMLALAVGGSIDLSRAAAKRQAIANAVELACQHAALEIAHQQGQANASSGNYPAVVNDIAQRKLRDSELSDVTVNSTVVNNLITITANGNSANVFGGILNYGSVAVGAERHCRSASVPPPVAAPSKVTFKLDYAYGWYWKRVSLYIHKEGDATDTRKASIVYQPNNKTGANGNGTGTVSGSLNQTLDLGQNYDKLYLMMEISTDGCPPDQSIRPNSGNGFTCGPITTQYPKTGKIITIKTNDPAKSNHLFVGGKQLPANAPASATQLFTCNKTVSHAWEDGGGWAHQDIGFSVEASGCSDNYKLG